MSHTHKCADCGHEWDCLLPMKGRICEVTKAARVNQTGPACGLCHHLEMVKRIAATRGQAISIVKWKDASKELPDSDLTVMLCFADDDIWPGYFDGENWCSAEGATVEDVTHWADLLEPPASEIKETK